MNREEIKDHLPHREPMLLIDKTVQEGDTTYSSYTVRGDEFFLQGHFPGKPVVPGVILCEIMAQASAMLMSDLMDRSVPLYAAIDDARFKRVVVPGDKVEVKAHLTAHRANVYLIDAISTVQGEMCCKAKLTFMIIPKDKQQ